MVSPLSLGIYRLLKPINRQFLALRKPLLSSRSIVIATSLQPSALTLLKSLSSSFKTFRGRMAAGINRARINQKCVSDIPKDGHVLENTSEARPLTIFGKASARTYNIHGLVLVTIFPCIIHLELLCRMRYSWDPLLNQSAGRRPTPKTRRLPITIVERPPTRLRTMMPLSSPSIWTLHLERQAQNLSIRTS